MITCARTHTTAAPARPKFPPDPSRGKGEEEEEEEDDEQGEEEEEEEAGESTNQLFKVDKLIC